MDSDIKQLTKKNLHQESLILSLKEIIYKKEDIEK
jgi:hypothetical protein